MKLLSYFSSFGILILDHILLVSTSNNETTNISSQTLDQISVTSSFMGISNNSIPTQSSREINVSSTLNISIFPDDQNNLTNSVNFVNMSFTVLPVGDENDDDDDDDDNEEGGNDGSNGSTTNTANPTTVTSNVAVTTNAKTELTSVVVVTTETEETGSHQPTTTLPSGGIIGNEALNADDDSGFVIILIIVSSVGGLFIIIALIVIVHVVYKRRKQKLIPITRRKHNSMQLERQRSFSNPSYLEHDIDILANRIHSASGTPKGDNFFKPEGDNYFKSTNEYDEVQSNRLSKQSANISIIGNSDLNYHEINVEDGKSSDSAKKNRKSVVSNVYDFLKFQGLKTFGKSDRVKIIENEVRHNEESKEDEYHTISDKQDLQATSLYDHVPSTKVQQSSATDQYDHVVPNIPSNESKETENVNENFKYQEMFPPITRDVDMYKECPIVNTEPRTSL